MLSIGRGCPAHCVHLLTVLRVSVVSLEPCRFDVNKCRQMKNFDQVQGMNSCMVSGALVCRPVCLRRAAGRSRGIAAALFAFSLTPTKPGQRRSVPQHFVAKPSFYFFSKRRSPVPAHNKQTFVIRFCLREEMTKRTQQKYKIAAAVAPLPPASRLRSAPPSLPRRCRAAADRCRAAPLGAARRPPRAETEHSTPSRPASPSSSGPWRRGRAGAGRSGDGQPGRPRNRRKQRAREPGLPQPRGSPAALGPSEPRLAACRRGHGQQQPPPQPEEEPPARALRGAPR